MKTEAFDYDLPDELIAQQPVEPRDSARMLVDGGARVRPCHSRIRDLPEVLEPGDVVVVNDTRVLPARLSMRKPSGGAAEVLLLENRGDGSWEALVRPSRRLRPGSVLYGAGGSKLVVGADLGGGRRVVRGAGAVTLEATLEEAGQVPLPPYITTPLADPERYQTVYSRRAASAAAPTAGLHLTRDLLARLEDEGVVVERVELVVGVDTFRPITTDDVEDHPMHSETYHVPPAVMDRCSSANRVLAVGTTTSRALESAAATGQLSGRTDLFIHGDFDFKVVDLMLTNFHFPRSSLLVMIDAFVGPRWRDLYRTAMEEGYRFLSFGDAVLLDREAARVPA